MPKVIAEVAAPIEDVWAIISDFGGLMKWHPSVVSCEVEGAGVGALRTVSLGEFWAVERLDELDNENHFLRYSVTANSRPASIGVKGSMSLTALGPAKTQIEWISGHSPDHPDAETVNARLAQYYPTRINHLRKALGLPEEAAPA